MKKIFLLILVIATSLFLYACTENSAKKDVKSDAEVKTQTTSKDSLKKIAAPRGIRYNVIRDQSKIEWTAKKITGQHNGTITLGRGEVFMENGKLTGGNFAIDMSTIRVLDVKDSASNVKLTNHLKSMDFFYVEKYPIGRFFFSNVSEINDEKGNNCLITGTMEFKGIRNEVKMPAKVLFLPDQTVSAEAETTLDRTLWDIKFRSGKFFENLGDNLISDDFNLKISFIAK